MGGGLLAIIAAMAQPLVARVLISMGLAIVTLGGVTQVVAQLRSLVLSKIGGIPMDALQLIGLAGIGDGLGILFGAISFALAYWGATQAVKIAGAG